MSSIEVLEKQAPPEHASANSPESASVKSGLHSTNSEDESPEEVADIGLRTWVAFAAFVFYNFSIVFAIGGPPFLLNQIGTDLGATSVQTWIPNSLSLVQAVTAPILAFVSDVFQARVAVVLVPLALGIIGAALAPGAHSVGRVIVGQSLIGVTLASIAIAYSVPSELLPRRWRPLVQSTINGAAALGFVCAPYIGAGFTAAYGPTQGWRNFYWVLMSLFATTFVLLAICYRPPHRTSAVEHLSFAQKLGKLDLPGAGLLAVGLGLLLAGLNLGGNPNPWSSGTVISLLVVGCGILVLFGLWEWKGTKEGILHHGLFSINRNFALLSIMMGLEGFVLFAIIIFYPPMVEALFPSSILVTAVKVMPFFLIIPPSTMLYGWICTKTKRIVEVLAFTWILWTGGYIGLAFLQPDKQALVIAMDALSGMGYAGPIVLIIALSQLSIPKELIATGTAVLTTARAIGATTATAIYSVAVNNRLDSLIPQHVGTAAAGAGLPSSSIPAFVGALAADDTSALSSIPGVTPAIIGAGVTALKQALADGFRTVFIIAAPICAVSFVLTLLLVNVQKRMTRYVDAPLEGVHLKSEEPQRTA